MIVFQSHNRMQGNTNIILLFGTGLIGNSICKSIIQKAEYTFLFLPFNWDEPSKSKQDQIGIYNFLKELSASEIHPRIIENIAFVWSAGKVGFSASRQNMIEELKCYDIVLDLVEMVIDAFPKSKISFHLLSSAGGLFEGRRIIQEETEPEPLRYYGQLKYKQETKLSRLPKRLVKSIYRPTSVYGFIGIGYRMGLIPTLILNGIQHKVSTIYGSLHTLRDYIFNDDVGKYIGKKLFNHNQENDAGIHLLGSGKPSSIYEIKNIVEMVVGRKIYLEFRSIAQNDNSIDIAVNPALLPEDWTYTNIFNGIKNVRETIISGKDLKCLAPENH